MYIKIENISIVNVDVNKYLGIMIEKNSNLKDHVSYIIVNEISKKKVNFLFRMGDSVFPPTRTIIHQSIIAPHIDY